MRHIFTLILGAIMLCAIPSCIEDGFTTSPSDVLTFSTDTLNFDTIFTDLGTPTARLKVFNRAKKSVSISSISMKEPGSMFAMNVDGVSGTRFQDVEIRGGDSIFIFVECRLPENDSKNPVRVEDAIVFNTNGVQQEVVLEAWGQDVTRLRGVTITEDTRLESDRIYVIFDSIVVDRGATLRIDPGTQVLFHDKARMTVRGRLEAIGAQDKMIDMRGDRLDNVLPDVSYDIMAGQWHGITIAPESMGNRMEYVNMRSTVQGLVVDSTANLSVRKLLLVNSWLHNSQGSALSSKYAWVDAEGCVFSEAAGHVVDLVGGKHNFVQCTLANYYLFSATWQSILGLYHLLPDQPESSDQPLMTADFSNCIIYGMTSGLNEGDLTGSQVFMRNVLLGAAGTDDANFIDCVWDANPFFYTVREDYYFNYRVQPDSPAIGAGNPGYVTALCRYDMDGVDRLIDGAPTIGAYQFTPPVEALRRR
ncbi:MAG: hypothetical protein HDS66_06560 [Bacteroidales bacterium]|nr:hypothetical protein [Bacteroidales bacterium]